MGRTLLIDNATLCLDDDHVGREPRMILLPLAPTGSREPSGKLSSLCLPQWKVLPQQRTSGDRKPIESRGWIVIPTRHIHNLAVTNLTLTLEEVLV